MTPHSLTIRPRYYELDPYGHVNHSVYVQYFEVARVELLNDLGYGLDRLTDMGYTIVAVQIATRFIRSAGLRDDLVVETGVASARRVTSIWAQRAILDDRVCASQLIELAMLDRNDRPCRFPGELAGALDELELPVDWLGSDAPDMGRRA